MLEITIKYQDNTKHTYYMSTSKISFEYFARIILGICYGEYKQISVKYIKERRIYD